MHTVMVDSPAPPLVAGDAGSERHLIDRAKAGEPAACDALARRCRRGAYLLALQMLGNRDDAMDVTQDAMLRFFSTLNSFDAARRVQPWLFTIVRNQVRDLWRQRQRRPADAVGESDVLVGQLVAPQPSPEADLHRQELRRRIWRALATLTADKREIIVLRDYHDLSYSDIAEVLGIPVGTVMSRLHGARRRLRARIEEEGGRHA